MSFTAKHLEAMFGEGHKPEEERAVRLGAAMIFAGMRHNIFKRREHLVFTMYPPYSWI